MFGLEGVHGRDLSERGRGGTYQQKEEPTLPQHDPISKCVVLQLVRKKTDLVPGVPITFILSLSLFLTSGGTEGVRVLCFPFFPHFWGDRG